MISHKSNERKLCGIFRLKTEKFMKRYIIKQNVGIDIAKDDFKVSFSTIVDDLSTTVKGTRTFSNNLSGFEDFIAWSKKKSVGELPVSYTMEATGVYYEGLAYHLFAQGFTVHVVLPNQAKKYGQSLGVKSKTDKIDAQTLASMGLERNLLKWEPFSPYFLVLKQLTREREAIICEQISALNRLHAYQHQGQLQPESIDRSERQLAFYKSQIEEIDMQIEAIVKSDESLYQRIEYIDSIKGVGFLTAVIIVAETNGFAGFTSIKQLTSFAGLDVRIAESGKWKGKSKISKKGNSHIRKALFMPSFSKVKYDPKTKQYYDRLSEKKGIKMMAAIAVQRKLLGLMYTLWKKQEMFNPDA